ncbi:hypothetical protein KNP414_00159 [Paenibacillus mucilaginosus KNP414]|uniref:Uncharacterized protein n=1 Tax=Paenibacillus mucilaginosus (strain KNP414) TaxID=1036673 RepID=F8FKV0_PAEMK|nr:hypothetical protein KNP414_00159 [Paenibacillus mucilaginosus KNP414]
MRLPGALFYLIFSLGEDRERGQTEKNAAFRKLLLSENGAYLILQAARG